MARRWLGLLASVAVSLGMLYLALRSIPLAGAVRALARADYGWVAPAALIFLLALVARAVRWRVLLDRRLGLGRTFNILAMGSALNFVAPARLGEVARAFLALRGGVPVFTTFSTILVERIFDMLTVVLLLGGSLLALPGLPLGVSEAGLALGGLALAALAAVVVFAHRPGWARAILAGGLRVAPPLARLGLDAVLERVLEGVRPLARWRRLALLVAWTGGAWALSVAGAYVLLPALFDVPRLAAAALLTATVSLSLAVPVTLANVGPYEWAVMVALVAVYGVNLWALPTTLLISPLARTPQAVAAVMGVQARAFSFAVVLHVLNVGLYVAVGALVMVYEGLSLRQIARGAEQLEARRAG